MARSQGHITGNKIPGPEYRSKKRKARNRCTTQAAMQSALDAHDRIMAVSTEIRKRHGLEPLTDHDIVSGWRSKLAGKPQKRHAVSKAPLSATEQVRAVAERRRKLDRDREAVEAEIRDLVAAKALPVSRMASMLGVSRQRLYQLAG